MRSDKNSFMVGHAVFLQYSHRRILSLIHSFVDSGVPRNFVRGGGVQKIQLRTEDRENGDLGAIAP